MTNIGNYLNGLQHIGLPCRSMEETVAFYEKLGMHVTFQTVNEGQRVCFLEQGNLVIEAYEEPQIADRTGAIDHICFDVTDIEKVFELVRRMQIMFCKEEICSLPFWENGVRFFTILGPNNERIEFCQKV